MQKIVHYQQRLEAITLRTVQVVYKGLSSNAALCKSVLQHPLSSKINMVCPSAWLEGLVLRAVLLLLNLNHMQT